MPPRPRRILVAALAAACASCAAPRHEQGWPRLRVGMSREEVRGLLGDPSTTYLPPAPADAGEPAAERGREPGARGERWQYGDSLSSLATRAVFPDEADERAWCVFFGPDGHLAGFRPPRWAKGYAEREPARPAGQPPLSR
jgi:hypothetical protein